MTKFYGFNKSNDNLLTTQTSVSIIKSFFNSVNLFTKNIVLLGSNKANILLGKPNFSITPDKVVITIFYFVNKTFTSSSIRSIGVNSKIKKNNKGSINKVSYINNNSINALGNALVRCWGRLVEIRLIRLNHVVLDSSILSENLSNNTNKFNFNRIIKILKSKITFSNNESIPNLNLLDNSNDIDNNNKTNLIGSSSLTGIKIKLSGRLTTQRSAPRQTKQGDRLGSSAKGIYSNTDYSMFTNKNKLGAFTIKVWISQQNS